MPVQPYTAEDIDYTVKNTRWIPELSDESCRAAIKGCVENMEQYDTVFVGFPIWADREPSIVDTFLDAYNFSGNRVIPFCTSGGSRLGKATEHIKGTLGEGVTVDAGMRLGAESTEEEVKK